MNNDDFLETWNEGLVAAEKKMKAGEKRKKLDELEDRCKSAYKYAIDYLQGTPMYDGNDFAGMNTNTEIMLARYRLLKPLSQEAEALIADCEEEINISFWFGIESLLSLWQETKNEYKIYISLQETKIKELQINKKTIGKSKQSITDFITHEDTEKAIEVLMKFVKGRKGKSLAMVIVAAKAIGIIKVNIPFAILEQLGATGNKSGYNNYKDEKFGDEIITFIQQMENEL